MGTFATWNALVLLCCTAPSWAQDGGVPAEPATALATDDYSNIYPEDYVGPEACGSCHEWNYLLWRSHPHSRMNQNPSADTVLGDFSGVRLAYGKGETLFERDGDDFVMTMLEGEKVVRRLQVTRVVGSRYYQFYVGLQIEGPEPASDPCYRRETKLPFAYLFRLERWLPELYFDSFAPLEQSYRDGVPYGDWIFDHPPDLTWDRNCVTCHNTLPYIARFRGAGWPKGFPSEKVHLIERDGAERWRPWTEKRKAIQVDDLVTLGVSCESCHFGGREHAVNGKEMRFVPTNPDLLVEGRGSNQPVRSSREDPYVINSICEQCHNDDTGVLRYPNGAGAWNSSEAADMEFGSCTTEIRCTDCHNPHEAGALSGAPTNPGHVAVCTTCHEQYEAAEAGAAHSRHSRESGVTCLDCHMPRMVQGLDTVVRTHRISSPTDVRMLAANAPNACNLCHLERSIGWTVAELNRGWGTTITLDEATVAARYGSLERPVGEAWLGDLNKVTRLIAADAYARSPAADEALPKLLGTLLDQSAVNRLFGQLAVQRALDQDLSPEDYDLLGQPKPRRSQVRKLRERFTSESLATDDR